MKKYEHPMRKKDVKVWSPMTAGEKFLAFIGAPGQVATHFTGDTAMQAHKAAQTFKDETIEKHEAAFIARAKARDERKTEAA